MEPLPRAWYTRETHLVAIDLLGKTLVHIVKGVHIEGIIVEVEAYAYPDDPASHAFKGITVRNEPLFGQPGHAYVYKSYGIHTCFNVVSHLAKNSAGGVLVRAIEPTKGVEVMMNNRRIAFSHALTSGPGNVCKAFGISMQDTYKDLTVFTSGLFITKGRILTSDMIASSSRVGLTKAREKQWRFFIRDNKWVSRHPTYFE